MDISRTGRILFAATSLALAGTASSDPARAGAWPLPEGETLVILPVTVSKATDGFNSSGKVAPRSSYSKNEVAPYVEYGLTESLTLVGTFAWLRDETDYYGITFRQQGFSRAEAGLRVSLGEWRGTRFAVQPVIAVHGTSAGDDPFASRRGDMDHELDVIAGRSFNIFGVDGFTDTLIGYRHRPAGRPAQFKSDVTLGLKPRDGTMLLVKSENFASVGRGNSAIASPSAAKLGASIVQDVAKPLAVEVGVMQTVAGRNIVRERALKFGLWHRF